MSALNLSALLEYAARRTPDKTYLLAGEESWTVAQVEDGARRVASLLVGLGVVPGDRVALLLPNVPLFAVCQFGLQKMGAVSVPLNVTSPGPEIASTLLDSEAVVLVAYEPYVEAAVEGLIASGSCEHLLVANLPGSEACPPGARRLAELMAAASAEFVTADTAPEDAATLLYTAGTTGRSKGVLLSHFANYFYANFLATDFWQLGPEDVILMVAPAAHIFGQSMLNMALVAGAAVSMLPRFDPEGFLRTIQQHKVTFFAGVPTLAHFMLHSPQVEAFDTSSLRRVMFGGAPLHPEVAERFRTRFQVSLITGYGMTEGIPMTFLNAETYPAAPSGTVGLPALGTTIRIVDDEDGDLPQGEIGEIVVRGPQMFREYNNQPKLSATAWRNGWFHTGDVGFFDAGGYLFLVDRLKDIIKRSGYTVSPSEVERVLHAHPAVAEAAVIGLPHEALGEEIKAFVVLKADAEATAEELIEHCKANLAAYKYPRLVEFRASLPKSPAGKVLRQALREEG